MKKQKKVKIENFIGIYDNYIPDLDCDKAIKLFEAQNKMNKCLDRIQSEGSRPSAKKDKQYFMTSSDIEIWYESLKTMIFNFDIALSHYLTETDAKSHLGEIFYGTGKIQKTLPTEGYHTWHTEQGYLHDQLTRV